MSQGLDRNSVTRRIAVYLSIAYGIGLGVIGTLLPDILAIPKITAVAAPLAQLLIPGFVAAFVGYGSSVYAEFYDNRSSEGSTYQRLGSWLTIIASLAVAISLVMLVLALLLFGEIVSKVQIAP